MARLDYDALNSTMRYLMFSVFSVSPGQLGEDRAAVVDETATFFKQREEHGVVVRGLYDVAGLRADADFMIWTHAERVEALQATYEDFRRTTTLGRGLRPVWRSSVCTARPNSTRVTCRPSWRARRPGRTCASTRSSARTSGICCPTRSGADARRARDDGAAVPGRAGQHRVLVRARVTTSGCWRSKRTNSIGSST